MFDMSNRRAFLDGSLDPTLWKKLPQELLERILSHAPFPSLVRFLAVSKHWSSVVIPDAARRGQIYGRSVVLYLHYDRKFFWFAIDLKMDELWKLSVPEPSIFRKSLRKSLRPVASEGGLLFFLDERTACVHVWNPVTRKHKVLNPPSTLVSSEDSLGLPFVGVAFTPDTGNYRLVVAGYLGTGEHIALLYDSMTTIWKRTGSLPIQWVVEDKVSYWKNHRSIYYEGSIYFSLHCKVSGDQVIFKYDVQKETWTEVEQGRHSLVSGVFGRKAYEFSTENRRVKLLFDVKFTVDDFVDIEEIAAQLMSPEDVAQLKRVIELFAQEELASYEWLDYFSFRQEDVFYHVIYAWEEKGFDPVGVLMILGHNVSDNSSTYFYQETAVDVGVYNFWAFTPSLVALV